MHISDNTIRTAPRQTRTSVDSAQTSYFLLFLLCCVLPLTLAWGLTTQVFGLVLRNDTFSQIPLIPIITSYLVYENRKAIFREISRGWILGIVLVVPGTILLWAARTNVWQLSATNPLTLFVFAVLLIWLGTFAMFFGTRAFRVACFPLLFLIFMVPIPEPLLSRIVYFLQDRSSDMTEVFFSAASVPYHRTGFIFDLPGVSIQVAEECSGIRSTLALLITTVLASYIFLRTSWKRLLLCVFVIPIAIFKNGLRIATLSTLAIYVNPDFLRGNLHHKGGIVFFLIALVPMAILLKLLQRGEKRESRTPTSPAVPPATAAILPSGGQPTESV
jgi:exosortase